MRYKILIVIAMIFMATNVYAIAVGWQSEKLNFQENTVKLMKGTTETLEIYPQNNGDEPINVLIELIDGERIIVDGEEEILITLEGENPVRLEPHTQGTVTLEFKSRKKDKIGEIYGVKIGVGGVSEGEGRGVSLSTRIEKTFNVKIIPDTRLKWYQKIRIWARKNKRKIITYSIVGIASLVMLFVIWRTYPTILDKLDERKKVREEFEEFKRKKEESDSPKEDRN